MTRTPTDLAFTLAATLNKVVEARTDECAALAGILHPVAPGSPGAMFLRTAAATAIAHMSAKLTDVPVTEYWQIATLTTIHLWAESTAAPADVFASVKTDSQLDMWDVMADLNEQFTSVFSKSSLSEEQLRRSYKSIDTILTNRVATLILVLAKIAIFSLPDLKS